MKENLKPGNWFDNDNTQSSIDEIRKLETHLANTYMDPYRAYTFNFFITQVDNEIWYDEDSEEHKDHVSLSNVLTATKSDKYVCAKCCKLNDKSNDICENCNHDPNTIFDRSAYYNVPSKLPYCPPSILLGEVIGVNPNSRENVKYVLKDITK